MQDLRAQNDGVEVEASFLGVPATVIHTTHHLENRHQLDAVGYRNPMLAVAGENVVVSADAIAGPNLSSLLANGRNPKSQLTLALQGNRFNVKTPNARHVAIKLCEIGLIQRLDQRAILGVFLRNTEGAVRSQELHHWQLRVFGHRS